MTSILTLSVLLAGVFALPHEKRSSNGPVITNNFQDPSVIQVDSSYYAYSGPNGNPSLNVQIASSQDFSSWQQYSTDVLPNPGAWTASVPHVWAPDINRLYTGQYVLYYCADTASNPGTHCIGAATGGSPNGPFTPLDSPLVCDIGLGGDIDPNGAFDPVTQRQYIVYKVDGNSKGSGGACSNSIPPIQPTPIMLQQVSSIDGITIIGGPVEILSNIAEDGPMIEAPALTFDPSSQTYILFYNSGCFTDTDYSVKYATSTSITGPYTRRGNFLTTGSTAANVQLPGGIDVTGDGTRAVFHGDTNPGWLEGNGTPRVRSMYAIDLNVGGGSVSQGPLL